MKNLVLLIVSAIFIPALLFGQATKPSHEMTMNGKVASFVMHESTGMPIIFTGKEIMGLNPTTKEVLWKVPRSTMNAIAEVDPSTAPDDYFEYHNTPYAFVAKHIINVATGEIIIDDEKDNLKKSKGYYILPDIETTLIETVVGSDIMLYGIGSFDSKVKWSTKIGSISALNTLNTTNSGSEQNTKIKPQLTKAGQLLYQSKKNLISIQPETGKINWEEKLNPGYLYMNDEATKLIVVEKKGGLGLPSLSAVEKFGKVIYSIDAVAGKSVWKKGVKMDGNVQFIRPFDGGVMVVHDEGLNIFDFDNAKGEGRWKKDYKEKGIRDVKTTDKGIVVYTKKTKMLVDPKKGEKVWKKAEKLEKVPNQYNMAYNNRKTSGKAYAMWQGGDYVVVKNGKKAELRADEVFTGGSDDYIGSIEYVYKTDSDGRRTFSKYNLRILDLESMKIHATSFVPKSALKSLSQTQIYGDQCFVSTDRHFYLYNISNDGLEQVANKYYKEPGAFGKGLGRITMGLAGAALVVGSAGKGVTSPFLSNNSSSGGKYMDQMENYAAASNAANDLAARKDKSTVTDQFAYFFTKNDAKELVLVKVDKLNGEEVKEFKFTDKSPAYMVDERNDLLYYGVGDQLKVFNLSE